MLADFVDITTEIESTDWLTSLKPYRSYSYPEAQPCLPSENQGSAADPRQKETFPLISTLQSSESLHS